MCRTLFYRNILATSAAGLLASNLWLLPCARAGAIKPMPVRRVVVPATIEAFDQTDVYAKTSGYLASVDVDIGDHVIRGQVLAIISKPGLLAELTEVEAKAATARQLADAASVAVLQARARLAMAKDWFEEVDAVLRLEQITLARRQKLFAAKAITRQQLDDSLYAEKSASAKDNFARAKVAVARADLASAVVGRRVALSEVRVADAETKRILALVGYTKIRSPFSGVVTRRFVNQGDLVQAATAASKTTTPLFTVERLDTVRIFCNVPERDVDIISVGDPASIAVFGFTGGVINAKMTRYAHALDSETRTMRTEIDVPNPQQLLLPGMYARVTIRLIGRANGKANDSSISGKRKEK